MSPRLEKLTPLVALAVVAGVMLRGLSGQWLPAPQPAAVPVEDLQPWMLQTAHGVGPVTAPRLWAAVQKDGLAALPESVRAQLAPLIDD